MKGYVAKIHRGIF